MSLSPINDKKYKWISAYYFFSSIIGLYSLSVMLVNTSLSLLIWTMFLIMYFQLIVMAIGAVLYWQRKLTGAKILSWVSLSLIPLIVTPMLIYIPKWTAGFAIFHQTFYTHTHLGFEFFIFGDITFNILRDIGWGLGINFIELALFFRFRRIIKENQSPPLNLKTYVPQHNESNDN